LLGSIIPNEIIIAGCITGAITVLLNPQGGLLQEAAGFAVSGGIFCLLHFVTKGSIGMGDVKLIACTGLFLGLDRVFSAMILSTVLSGIAGVILIIINIKNRKSEMPFAPFILGGTMLAILYA
jgi:prepilin signal peptidase PulO-like enzyme (type II secretory pathway)